MFSESQIQSTNLCVSLRERLLHMRVYRHWRPPTCLARTLGINTLNDDVLLIIFNHYRLDNEINWNIRAG